MHSVQSVQSRAQHTFARSPQANIQRAAFNRSHGYKTTFDEGWLVPIFVDEVLPGDTFNLKMTAFARLATPIFPIMDNIYLETFFFFVPNRIVWEHWEAFNGDQSAGPTASTDYVLPTITTPDSGTIGVQTGDLADYMGIPIGIGNLEYQALPIRAYQMIYNEWFRDENLQDPGTFNTDDGPDAYNDVVLMRRGKRHDYFTSCLPWPQKINDGTIVEIPLGLSAPVTRISGAPSWMVYESGTDTPVGDAAPLEVQNTGSPVGGFLYAGSPSTVQASLDPNGGLITDLSTATAATINQLRQAFQLQKLFEHDARGGTRYTEIIRSHFGVVSPDMRLQRPEYLGGGSTMININPVAQTSPATGDSSPDNTPQGNLAAFGTAHAVNHGFVKSFTEHGHIIGLVSTRADINYQQGLNRMWSRSTRYDFYWPSLSHIGEQAVLNKEIYAEGDAGLDNEVFGYQERYAEYRYKPALITGLFRSAAAGSLDSWHLAQDFSVLPTLDNDFIVENAPMARIEAVPDEYDFLFDAYFDLKCVRPMSLYGVPGWVDHF